MNMKRYLYGMGVVAAGLFAPLLSAAQEKPRPPIEDNSFLVEEAYNQERGIVQHISSFERTGTSWEYNFTQEWPVRSQKHQLGFTLPVQNTEPELGGGVGIGDIGLNYRYQLLSGEGSAIALSPRFTLLLPTGDERNGRGAETVGYQANVPMSIALSDRFVAHSNVGVTLQPAVRNGVGDELRTTTLQLGQSVVWLLHPSLNLLLESVWTRSAEAIHGGGSVRSSDLLVAPGIRGALDFDSGLQVVPGAAVAFDVGPAANEPTLFFYLSFEHPFTRRR